MSSSRISGLATVVRSLAAVVVVAYLAGLAFVGGADLPRSASQLAAPLALVPGLRALPGVPAMPAVPTAASPDGGHGDLAAPETEAAEAVADPGDPADHAFTATNRDGSPARWNPCAPVHYIANFSKAPAGAREDLARAFADLSAATGLSFVYDGETELFPTARWASRPWPGRARPPAIVAWAEPSDVDVLRPAASGVTEAYRLPSPRGKVIVSGVVILNANHNPAFESGFGPVRPRGALLRHELGHLVGLAHVAERTQLMYPTSRRPHDFAAGDRAGLARLGQGGCLAP